MYLAPSMDLKKMVNDARKKEPQRKRRTRRRQTEFPYEEDLSDDILWEILIRLPVESVARFKSVSKAWHAIISDSAFVRSHLHCSKQKHHHNPSSFLIIPQIYLEPDPSNIISTNIRFYLSSLQQQHQQDDTMKSGGSASATLLYGKHLPAGEFGLVSEMAHCDGLVLLPTNTNTYIFNPAMRDVLVLPESHRDTIQYLACLPIGFGLDASTGRYKVARSFYRSRDDHHVEMGMEVFIINDGQDGSWRETSMDPPALILCPQTAVHCKGSLFYFIDKKNQPCSPRSLLRFSLQDETFGFTPLLPDVYPQVEDQDILLHELDGELCATFFSKLQQRVLIWMTRDILDPQWKCHCIINFSEQCYPMASLSNRGILLRSGNRVFRYYLETHGVKQDETCDMDELRFIGPTDEHTMVHAWENLCWFDLFFYTESLVPITPKARLQAL